MTTASQTLSKFEAIMLKFITPSLRTAIAWLPIALLLATIVEPSIWQPLWSAVENTSDALADHANRLTYELNWRLMHGAI